MTVNGPRIKAAFGDLEADFLDEAAETPCRDSQKWPTCSSQALNAAIVAETSASFRFVSDLLLVAELVQSLGENILRFEDYAYIDTHRIRDAREIRKSLLAAHGDSNKLIEAISKLHQRIEARTQSNFRDALTWLTDVAWKGGKHTGKRDYDSIIGKPTETSQVTSFFESVDVFASCELEEQQWFLCVTATGGAIENGAADVGVRSAVDRISHTYETALDYVISIAREHSVEHAGIFKLVPAEASQSFEDRVSALAQAVQEHPSYEAKWGSELH